MKKFTYSVAIAATLLASSNTFAQQGFGTNTPHRSSAVEIKSSNKGLLIPRVALNSETQQLGLVANANSLLVFNETGLLDKGYYYWDENYVVTPAQGNTAAVTGKWVAFSTAEGATYTANNGIAKTEGSNNFELGTNPIFKATNLNISNGGSLTITSTTAPFTIASGNNNFGITGLVEAPSTVVPYLILQDNDLGTVYNAAPSDYFSQFIKGKNGITIEEGDQADLHVKLGGTIDEVTNLHIADNASVSVTGLKKMDGSAVTPADLDESVADLGGNGTEASTGHLIPVGTTMNGTLKVATAKEIVDAGIVSVQHDIVNSDGTLHTQGDKYLQTTINGVDESNLINLSAIVSGGLEANNGLTKTDNLVQLGGDLVDATVIRTGISATEAGNKSEEHTLAITGLTSNNVGAHKNVTVDTNGVLRTTERIFVGAASITALTEAQQAASESIEQIVYKITLTADQTIFLPNATASNKGQEVNVIIDSSTEAGTLFISGTGGSLDITSAGYSAVSNLLAYGGMNGQKWTFKSNGSAWEVVSRM